MLNRRAFTLSIVGLLAGCGASPPPAREPKRPALTASHLTDRDVAALIDVVKSLPDQKPPAFQPAVEVDLQGDTRAADMVARWQREFRSSYSPQVQAKLWKRDSRLRLAIDESGFEPEELATLLVRLSAAVVRESLHPEIDLVEMGRQADHAIGSLCRQFDSLDGDPRLSPTVRNGRSDFLANVLKETVAYREFLRLLESVPAESVETVARHRVVLRTLMPATETVQAFEKRFESQAKVLRASHAEPARSGARR
ncbi:MAG TPA: hypothetical protein VM452_04805 [Caulifigura sp.]|nr:hypothetical protein [Caulifigura sp.]